MTEPCAATEAALIDPARSVKLIDGNGTDYTAAVAVAADGSEHLVLALNAAINDDSAVYNSSCHDVYHEQLGPLPLEVVQHMTIAASTPRCGHPTKTGLPCRIRVSTPGTSCAWHRTIHHERAPR